MMDMSVMSSSMLSNLASLQSAISMTMLDRSMEMAPSELDAMLQAQPQPTATPSFGHKLDLYA